MDGTVSHDSWYLLLREILKGIAQPYAKGGGDAPSMDSKV